MKTKYYEFTDYQDWDHQIFEAALLFEAENGIWPNILLGNSITLEAIDLFMTKKLMSEGKVTEVKTIETFACERGDIQICIDQEIPDHAFKLIYDEEAEFIDEEGHENSVSFSAAI